MKPLARDNEHKRVKLRAAMSDSFLVFTANVGGLRLQGRSEGGAAGLRVGGALSKSAKLGSKWDRVMDLAKQLNADEQLSKRYGLFVFTETRVGEFDKSETRIKFTELGYKTVIVWGVKGRGEKRARTERAGVIIAWDPKSLEAVTLRHGRLYETIVKGRVVHMRFRVRGSTLPAGDPPEGPRVAVSGVLHSDHTNSGIVGNAERSYDLDLLACYMPQRRGSTSALKEASRAWRKLIDKVGALAGYGRLLIAGDLNAESAADLQRRGKSPTPADDSLDQLEQSASVTGLGPRGEDGWTSVRFQGTAQEVKSRIDHFLAGSAWAARVLRTDVVDGIEMCTTGGHCHRALQSEVKRWRREPEDDPDWRPRGVTLCANVADRPKEACVQSSRSSAHRMRM